MRLSRRVLLGASLAAAATSPSQATGSLSESFAHGVASGDPGDRDVVLWTRVTTNNQSVNVALEVSIGLEFQRIVHRSAYETNAVRDFTVKAVVTGLERGQTYYYRFSTESAVSDIGRTRTLQHGASRARFALVSCANYQRGYFHAYGEIAKVDDLDAVIHLGDYIYEHGADHDTSGFTEDSGRYHDPPHACVTIDDYRRRFAQYRSDPNTKAMHAAHPMIAIWDDHETADNAWRGGASAHDPEEEAAWTERRDAAMRAYSEWMPVRDGAPLHNRFGSFVLEDFLTIGFLETRLTARDRPFGYTELVEIASREGGGIRAARSALNDPNRKLVNQEQLDYLEVALRKSVSEGETWRLLANQVMMATARTPNLKKFEQRATSRENWPTSYSRYSEFDLPYSLDAWGGYPAAREALCNRVISAGVRDLVVLTGDSHQTWANELYSQSDIKIGLEIGVTAVSSPHWLHFLGSEKQNYSLDLMRENRGVLYHDAGLRGFTLLHLDQWSGSIEHIGIDSVETERYRALTVSAFQLERTFQGLRYVPVSGLSAAQLEAFRA